MEKIKTVFNKFLSFKWYYQLLSALVGLLSLILFIRFLVWIVPIVLGILMLMFVFTEGEIFSNMWGSYKERKQVPVNPLVTNLYHWLTEQGITELPVSTLRFIQGVELPSEKQGIYFIHLEKEISDELLGDFEIKVRQTVKFMSNGHTDCIISKVRREPFLAIKVRLVATDEMVLLRNQVEEDF